MQLDFNTEAPGIVLNPVFVPAVGDMCSMGYIAGHQDISVEGENRDRTLELLAERCRQQLPNRIVFMAAGQVQGEERFVAIRRDHLEAELAKFAKT